MIKKQKFGVIGAGNVGSAVAKYLSHNEMLEWVLARTDNSFGNISDEIPESEIIRNIDDIISFPEFTIIAVSDTSIRNIADSITNKFSDLSEKYFTHCSGTLGKSELTPLENFGGTIAAAHPYQTFYNSGKDTLKGIPWGIDADISDEKEFAGMIRLLGGIPVILSDKAKVNKELYHISAVAASNYLNTLLSLSGELLIEIELDPELLLKPIIETTLKNNFGKIHIGGTTPLTGPIVRGDTDTIRKHITALDNHPTFLEQYKLMGRATLETAISKKIISREKYKELEKLFT